MGPPTGPQGDTGAFPPRARQPGATGPVPVPWVRPARRVTPARQVQPARAPHRLRPARRVRPAPPAPQAPRARLARPARLVPRGATGPAGATGAQGPAGPAGATGASGTAAVTVITASGAANADSIGVDCAGTARAVGGGGSTGDTSSGSTLHLAPLEGDSTTDIADSSGDVPTGWFAEFDDVGCKRLSSRCTPSALRSDRHFASLTAAERYGETPAGQPAGVSAVPGQSRPRPLDPDPSGSTPAPAR